MNLTQPDKQTTALQYNLLIEYAIHGMPARLFVQKYQLYPPDKQELKRLILGSE